MNDQLLEPLKYFEDIGRQQHEQNTNDYFNELLAKSGVNEEENRATVRAYNRENETIQNISKKISKYKTFRILLIIAIVIGAVLLFTGFSQFSTSVGTGIILLLIGIAAIAGSIVALVKKVNPVIKDANALRDKHMQQANELLRQAEEQMAPLNALFDDTDTFRLIERTIPEFSFDRRYTKDHETFFVNQHDFLDLEDDESSMTNTVSGRFAGNPFLFCRRTVHEMGSATYNGSLTISWTETYRDSNGNVQTRRKTQTLHASVTKPKPMYYSNNYLNYGCQAAPDLSFNRSPQHSENLSEKALAKKIRSGEKQLQKQAERATKKGGNFQEMANSEFDVLFGANDRDHEVQFRLMFTPLAQRNTVALMTSKTGFGDDFHFNKRNKFNVITSEHAQDWNMNTSASNYYSYDVDTARTNFLSFNTKYFKSVFFDFAPIFSIPAYMEEPCASLEMPDEYSSNYTYYEHEVMANAIGIENFVHEESATDAILKTELVEKRGDIDIVAVTAYSYATAERIDYVPVRGGDGNYHNVPVPWIEYIPVSKTTPMVVELTDMSEKEARIARNTEGSTLPDGTYFHGMVARALTE